ncbi:MAG: hypothetical protein PHG85_02740 [Candidatus Altiarchaeota archaeon]|nr:hypothetical protein [Candidatus Altiarchaeota archaeon]
MITYADIQRIYRTEGNTPTLEQIPDDFYEQVPILLSQVGEEHRSHINKFVLEIHTKRRNKIMLHALRICDKTKLPPNATTQENKLYTAAVDLIQEYSNRMLSKNNVKKAEHENQERKIRLRMLKPTPNIVGSDLHSYGPFKEDDISELPESNAIILIKQAYAEELGEKTEPQEGE